MIEYPNSRTLRPAADMLVPAIVAAVIMVALCFQSRLFNDGDTGWHLAAGKLILSTVQVPIFAGLRPFIDGRADMYGDGFFRDFNTISNGDAVAFQKAARQWGIRWTILSPTSSLVARLDHLPGWHRIYADRWAVVHTADAAPSHG